MEGDKPLTRDALVSMQVIDARGRLVGQVKDLVFAVGKMGVSLAVENTQGEVKNIGWEEVQAAADYIILKPQLYAQNAYQQPVQQQQTQAVMQQQPIQQQPVQPVQPQRQASQPMCPTCGKPLTWIAQYQRWYCYNDKKYV
ncbi:MAG: PRC-barrel domain-containing protein [Betaproteobacteria bacterium]